MDFLHGVGAKGFFSEYFSRCYFRFMCAQVNRLGYCPRVIHTPMCGEILTVQGGHSLHIYIYIITYKWILNPASRPQPYRSTQTKLIKNISQNITTLSLLSSTLYRFHFFFIAGIFGPSAIV